MAALRPHTALLFVRIVPGVLAGLGTVLPEIFLSCPVFFYSNGVCVLNDEASFRVLLSSQKQKGF